MYSTKDKVLKQLQHYCAYQDRCQMEVEQKLKQLRVDPEYNDEIFLELLKDGFINEERFAKSYARGKFRIHHWGKLKIRNYLKAKRIGEPLLTIALNEINPEEYYEQLKIQLQKIYSSYKNKSKSINNLISKGYELDLIYQAADDLKLKGE
ncbi:MAG TPA: RecX family transcriptional regulator [Saprospiraceae bacterium]|nr:RecX family transcriptional regulator [Saprospiraceae bacterium]